MSLDRSVEQAIRVLEESLLEPGVRASAAEIEWRRARQMLDAFATTLCMARNG